MKIALFFDKSKYLFIYTNHVSLCPLLCNYIEPPSAPVNLTVKNVDQSSVTLSWNAPRYLGGRNDTVYRVECNQCPPTVSYLPAQDAFNETKVTITGLNPYTTYRFMVYAENGVSGHELSQYQEITVTTESSGKLTNYQN